MHPSHCNAGGRNQRLKQLPSNIILIIRYCQRASISSPYINNSQGGSLFIVFRFLIDQASFLLLFLEYTQMDYQRLLQAFLYESQRTAGGGGQGGGAPAATQRETSDAMLARAEQYLYPIFGGFLATEKGRELLISEAAAPHLVVFVLSLASFIFLALILRVDFHGFTIPYIDDCTAFLRIMIFISLIGAFTHDKLPWITYTPLLFLPLILVQALAGQGAAGGGDGDGRAHAARRQTSDTMLNKAEQILKPVVAAFLVTEEGRNLMMSEAAAQHQMILALSTAGLNILALIRRFDFTGFLSPYIDDCSAILRATMLMSLIGTFMRNKFPWITYIPVLLFVLLLVIRALVHIYRHRGLNNENITPAAHMD